MEMRDSIERIPQGSESSARSAEPGCSQGVESLYPPSSTTYKADAARERAVAPALGPSWKAAGRGFGGPFCPPGYVGSPEDRLCKPRGLHVWTTRDAG